MCTRSKLVGGSKINALAILQAQEAQKKAKKKKKKKAKKAAGSGQASEEEEHAEQADESAVVPAESSQAPAESSAAPEATKPFEALRVASERTPAAADAVPEGKAAGWFRIFRTFFPGIELGFDFVQLQSSALSWTTLAFSENLCMVESRSLKAWTYDQGSTSCRV